MNHWQRVHVFTKLSVAYRAFRVFMQPCAWLTTIKNVNVAVVVAPLTDFFSSFVAVVPPYHYVRKITSLPGYISATSGAQNCVRFWEEPTARADEALGVSGKAST